jgi:hypothetical protein
MIYWARSLIALFDCHPERSEGSRYAENEMLRFAQHDKLIHFENRSLYPLAVYLHPECGQPHVARQSKTPAATRMRVK